jgi:hypothetical protein
MASRNDITGDLIASRLANKQWNENYDSVTWTETTPAPTEFWFHSCGSIKIQTAVGKTCPICNKPQ